MSPPIREGSGDSIGSIRLGDGSEIAEVRTGAGDVLFSAIPDSAINQYQFTDFSTSEWSDSIGSLNLTTISGLQADGTAFDGTGGVESPTQGDFAQDSQFSFLQNNYYSQWAFAVGFSTTDNNGFLWSINSVNNGFNHTINCGIGRDATNGHIGIGRRFNSNSATQVESNVPVNDGNEYVALIQSTGPAASDLEIYFEPSVNSATINASGATGTSSESFSSTDMTYFARNDQGTIIEGLSMTMTRILWADTPFTTQSERQQVFNLYPWYDPATDTP